MDIEYNYNNENDENNEHVHELNNNIKNELDINIFNKNCIKNCIKNDIIIQNLQDTIDKKNWQIINLKNELIIKEEIYNYNILNINNDYQKLNSEYNNLFEQNTRLKEIINYKNDDITKLSNMYMNELKQLDDTIREYKNKNIFNSYYLITISIFFISYILYDSIKIQQYLII
jgi:hypothetical protein